MSVGTAMGTSVGFAVEIAVGLTVRIAHGIMLVWSMLLKSALYLDRPSGQQKAY